MHNIRTDLAAEAREIALKNKKHTIDGVIFREEEKSGYKLTRVEIVSKDGESATGKPMGKYLSLNVGKIWNRGSEETEVVCTLLGDMIYEVLGDVTSVLVVGLGNTDITADALGPKTVSHILVTRHLKNEEPEIFKSMEFFDVSAFAPGVLSQTGIETAETLKSIAERIKPSAIIAIDALASGDTSRLGTVVQVSNTGIAPGSGVCNRRATLNSQSLGVPVIAVGIPTVVDAITLAYDVTGAESKTSDFENMFVTPKDCDKIISFMSRIIGYSINAALHRKLSFEDIMSVLS